MALSLQLEKKLDSFRLSLSLESDSRRLGILGASGCGKSMTLKSMAGVVSPDRGRIVLDGRTLYDSGQKVNLPPKERGVGYLFQNYALFPAMTVARNVSAGLHCSRAERERRTAQLVERFRLQGLENRYPGQLSGGQQQRVALARMMAPDPQAILLDEPFSALDLSLRETLQEELMSFLADFPGQAVMVSHSLEELYRFCETMVVMDQGQALLIGPREEIVRNPRYIRAAQLTGCGNILPARRVDEHHLYLPGWELTLATCWPVEEQVTALGIHPKAFLPAAGPGENTLNVQAAGRTQTPFQERILLMAKDRPQAPQLWWERPGGREELPQWVTLPPDQVLPLK